MMARRRSSEALLGSSWSVKVCESINQPASHLSEAQKHMKVNENSMGTWRKHFCVRLVAAAGAVRHRRRRHGCGMHGEAQCRLLSAATWLPISRGAVAAKPAPWLAASRLMAEANPRLKPAVKLASAEISKAGSKEEALSRGSEAKIWKCVIEEGGENGERKLAICYESLFSRRRNGAHGYLSKKWLKLSALQNIGEAIEMAKSS